MEILGALACFGAIFIAIFKTMCAKGKNNIATAATASNGPHGSYGHVGQSSGAVQNGNTQMTNRYV